MSKTIHIKLFGGEQDGYECDLEIDRSWPETFYVYRLCDEKRIKDARDPNMQKLLVDNLAVLAYEFTQADPKDNVRGGKQFRYDRRESADKRLTDPAV